MFTRALAVLAAAALLVLPATSSSAADPTFHYVTMSDGVEISVQVFYPEGYDGGAYPTVFEMDGYTGSSDEGGTFMFDGPDYVRVRASARGSGCSGGKFDLLSYRTAMDGYELIENWIVQQPWSNGKVGVVGHSYPGLTGFQIAALNPPHLTATAVSGIIDDFYRGIFYPGGVPNLGFPAIWEGAYRPSVDAQATVPRLAAQEERCVANAQSRGTWNWLQAENIAEAYTQREATEGSWAISRGLMRFVGNVRAPIQLEQQYLDEQTGPRGANNLFEHLPPSVPKRLILSNGQHNDLVSPDQNKAWLDCWLLKDGEGCGDVNDPAKRVVIYFESMKEAPRHPAPYTGSDWPLPETAWTRYFLGADGVLSTSPTRADGERTYASASGRQTAAEPGGLGVAPGAGALTFSAGSAPDTLRWDLDFDRPTAVAGPMALNLWARSTASDTDFFIDVMDLDEATGELSYLQRGVLRASHREVDPARADRIKSGPLAGTVYRHWHPHVDPEPLTPMESYRFQIEVFPFSHVFREGHRMVVQLHAPPANDPVSVYAWAQEHPPALNTVLQGPGARSSLLVPVLPTLPPMWEAPPACGSMSGIACFKPAA